MNEPPVHYGPDWQRMGIAPPNQYGPLGDPTRWGASITLNTLPIVQPAQQGGITRSAQILTAQCRDGYSRAWTLAGTFSTTPDLLAAPDGGDFGEWALGAVVSMGVGQLQILQTFNLRAIANADAPFYWNADPSDPFYFTNVADPVVPFIIPGGLIGNAINVSIVQSFRYTLGDLPAIPIRLTMILCPFDPGAK